MGPRGKSDPDRDADLCNFAGDCDFGSDGARYPRPQRVRRRTVRKRENIMTLLGKVIQIDVSGASAVQPYVVLWDNPFVDLGGELPEIWGSAVRNLWRMAFDSGTGPLWIGDVRQNSVEEISVVSYGGNYSWNLIKGNS